MSIPTAPFTTEDVKLMLADAIEQAWNARDDETVGAITDRVLAEHVAAAPITLAAAGERVEAHIRAAPRGSGLEGMRLMFAAAGFDGDEAFNAISGISDAVPSPLTEGQHEALLMGLTIALLAGYEAGGRGAMAQLAADAIRELFSEECSVEQEFGSGQEDFHERSRGLAQQLVAAVPGVADDERLVGPLEFVERP
jgi:hypothetical protein